MIDLQIIKMRFFRAKEQFKASWKDALLSSLAAGVSWFISQNILGHPNPIFAAITAMICLAPGLPSHGKQSIYVLTGVVTGVSIGEASLLLPPLSTEIRIVVVGFITMTLVSSYAVVPAIITQAGVSAIMVFAMGAYVAGLARLIDVVIGAGVALVFSQIFFTPNPVRKFNVSVARFFNELANNYMLADKALSNRSDAQAGQALKSCELTHNAVIGLIAAIDVARTDARWTLRGRFSSREVTFLSTRYYSGSIRLYAASLLLCEAISAALRKKRDSPPEWLEEAVGLAQRNSLYLAGSGKNEHVFVMPDRSKRDEPSISWREAASDIELIENILARLYKSKTHKKRFLISRRKKLLDSVRREVELQKIQS